MHPIEIGLEQRFYQLLQKLSSSQCKNFACLWLDLKNAYQQPHRHYHTLQHIHECLQYFEKYHYLAKQPIAVEFALWFHDIVYLPKQTDNELQSAHRALQVLQQGKVTANLQRSVYDLIMATAHQQAPQTQDEKLIVDIDLSILAARPERFYEYQQQIRAEYAWVEDTVYQQKRREILTKLYNKGDIYHLAEIKVNLENAVKLNLQPLIF